jgi:hypothetical protein
MVVVVVAKVNLLRGRYVQGEVQGARGQERRNAASAPKFIRAAVVIARRQSTNEEMEKQACTMEWQACKKWRQACKLQSAARINLIKNI